MPTEPDNAVPALIERLAEALRKIRDEEGRVCPEFEICRHESCRSSYTAWAIADAALAEYDRERKGGSRE